MASRSPTRENSASPGDPLKNTTADNTSVRTPTSETQPANESLDLILPPTSTLPPPSDGGFTAWAQVAVAHLGSFNSWGYMNSFGLFQSYYTTTLPGATPSAISWIGSLQIFLAFGVGSVSGRALDAGYLRTIVIAGCCLQVLGIMSASAATTYWQLILAQGLCKGLGDGLVFCPTVANIPTYFSVGGGKRAMAMGIAATGTATGGIVFPLIAQRLMPQIGYGWTVRVMGFIVIFNAAVMVALAKARSSPTKKSSEPDVGGIKGLRKTLGGLFEWSAFRNEPPYAIFCAGAFSIWLPLYFAFYYVTAFGKDLIRIDTSTSLTLLLVMNAIGAPARVLFGFLSDRFLGPLNALTLAIICTSIMFYSWIAVHDLPGLYAFCCLYGFSAAACQGLFPAAIANLTQDPRKMGARTGMAFAIVSVATLIGPPIGGALVQAKGGEYLYAQAYGGSVLVLGALLMITSNLVRRKKEARQPQVVEE